MGLEDIENQGFHVNDITLLIEGHIPKNYRFNPSGPMIPADKSYIKTPKAADKSHLVVFCINATSLEMIPKTLERKIALLQEKIKDMGIPRMLILTHTDELCEEVAKDITKLFHSTAVAEAVEKAGLVFKMTRAYIHPVVNYDLVTKPNKHSNVPLMLALQQMLDVSYDYFQRTYCGDDDEGGWWEWLGCNLL